MATVHGYAAIGDVSARLRTGAFSGSTVPTTTVVEDIMSKVENEIIKKTGHAWDTTTVTDEYYYFGGRPRVRMTYRDGESSVDPDIEEAYAEYFAKGGTVTVCNPDARSENAVTNPWQRGKKKTEKK